MVKIKNFFLSTSTRQHIKTGIMVRNIQTNADPRIIIGPTRLETIATAVATNLAISAGQAFAEALKNSGNPILGGIGENLQGILNPTGDSSHGSPAPPPGNGPIIDTTAEPVNTIAPAETININALQKTEPAEPARPKPIASGFFSNPGNVAGTIFLTSFTNIVTLKLVNVALGLGKKAFSSVKVTIIRPESKQKEVKKSNNQEVGTQVSNPGATQDLVSLGSPSSSLPFMPSNIHRPANFRDLLEPARAVRTGLSDAGEVRVPETVATGLHEAMVPSIAPVQATAPVQAAPPTVYRGFTAPAGSTLPRPSAPPMNTSDRVTYYHGTPIYSSTLGSGPIGAGDRMPPGKSHASAQVDISVNSDNAVMPALPSAPALGTAPPTVVTPISYSAPAAPAWVTPPVFASSSAPVTPSGGTDASYTLNPFGHISVEMTHQSQSVQGPSLNRPLMNSQERRKSWDGVDPKVREIQSMIDNNNLNATADVPSHSLNRLNYPPAFEGIAVTEPTLQDCALNMDKIPDQGTAAKPDENKPSIVLSQAPAGAPSSGGPHYHIADLPGPSIVWHIGLSIATNIIIVPVMAKSLGFLGGAIKKVFGYGAENAPTQVPGTSWSIEAPVEAARINSLPIKDEVLQPAGVSQAADVIYQIGDKINSGDFSDEQIRSIMLLALTKLQKEKDIVFWGIPMIWVSTGKKVLIYLAVGCGVIICLVIVYRTINYSIQFIKKINSNIKNDKNDGGPYYNGRRFKK